MTTCTDLRPGPSELDPDVLHDLFVWLRDAGAEEDYVPSRILRGCVEVERGISPAQAQRVVDAALAALGHGATPVLVSGRDAAAVLRAVAPAAR